MATATIAKTPDQNDTPIAFDFPKEIAPFVRDYYDALKREGESLDGFALRLVCEQGVEFVRASKDAELRSTRETQWTTDSVAINQEKIDLLAGA